MSSLWALTSREWKAFWYSPIAYTVGALFLLLQGAFFWMLLLALNDPRTDPGLTMSQIFFGDTFFYWLSVLVTVPLLTMRAFSEEKRTGSIELLLTAPVTDAHVVPAKFLGAWLAYIVLWSCTIVFFLLLRTFTAFDWRPVLTGYLGTWLLGGALISVGVLASSLTRNQVIAAVLTFVITLMLFSVGILDVFIHDPQMSQWIRSFSLIEQLRSFAKGIVDTRPIVCYVSVAAVCLFTTGRLLNSPRWRS